MYSIFYTVFNEGIIKYLKQNAKQAEKLNTISAYRYYIAIIGSLKFRDGIYYFVIPNQRFILNMLKAIFLYFSTENTYYISIG